MFFYKGLAFGHDIFIRVLAICPSSTDSFPFLLVGLVFAVVHTSHGQYEGNIDNG